MSYGCWAMIAWSVPSLRAATWTGPASKPTTWTCPFTPACSIPVAAPSALNRFVANTALRSGCFCSVAVTMFAASAGWFFAYCTPTYSYMPSFAAASSKPLTRSSLVEMPGWLSITSTFPPPGTSCWMAVNAAAPPPMLSDAISETANDGSSTVVSTSTTLESFAASSSGRWRALTSLGAMRMADGLVAATEATMGCCSAGSHFCGPWTETSAPSSAAASLTPHSMEM